MTHAKTWMIVAFVVSMAMVSFTAGRRLVEMDLTLPNGGAPHLKIMEGQTATIGLPDGPTFGLIPSFQAGDDRTVVLSISDIKANPSRELGTVKAMVGGDWVASGTTPEFQIRISGVTTQK